MLRLEFEHVRGWALSRIWPDLTAKQRTEALDSIRGAVSCWRSNRFIHGDLAPQNILVHDNPLSVRFIDWVVDLKSFEGTPQFTAAEVYRGIRTHGSDVYGMKQIFELFDSSCCIVSR